MLTFIYSLLPFLRWSKDVNQETLKADVMAGITGAILVLPQGVAYALIAGLPPEFGLYTAIVSATFASFFGSSMHMISGPTAALSIVAATVITSVTADISVDNSAVDYITLMITLTFMVGVIQLALGFLNFGVLVNFISHSVVQGFTSGAAVIIAASQMKNLLGFQVESNGTLMSYIMGVLDNIKETNITALSIGLVTVAIAFMFKRYVKRVPYLLGAMVLGALLCFLIDGAVKGVFLLDELSGTLPPFRLPSFDSDVLSVLLSGAFAVALLGLIEAASIARSIAMRSKQQIEGNQEFIGQGVSNVIGGFLSCYPSSGSFTRSGGNYDAGAKTPLASLFSALLVILFVLFIPSITRFIPVPVMAGSIIVITWNLFDVKGFIETLKSEKAEVITFLGTFVCTLCIQLEFAIYVGVLISIGCYLHKTSRPKVTLVAPLVSDEGKRRIRNVARYALQECPEVKMIRVDGSIFFGSSEHLQKSLQGLGDKGHDKVIVISKGINFIDATGQHMLINEIERIEKKGGRIIFSSLKGNVCDDLEKTELKNQLDDDRLFDTTSQAISDMIQHISAESCTACTSRVFHDCPVIKKRQRCTL
ncbi:SulP family inorganic anion transporter [Marinomonas colpomeniae]|uniref:SulP family inorganic anion transporter n=1 Tax=Marinomonas colpomeniae TaxID=2774408 RepID=A0ABR8P0I5_9GAMM|nr:SulP family inorganic anion transporter [Marinomonas colpomeniae]MBD5771803.1 SulP family inorganic anion transporter [Marinomonas colpomeniae]